MNITPHAPIVSIPTASNPPTETLRRENHQREVISQVSAASKSAAEKGVASEKERARTPAQTNEQFDFANLRKQAEQDARQINGEHQGGGEHQHADQEKPQPQANNAEQTNNDEQSNENAVEQQKAEAEAKVINELEQRDQEVRKHEQAHASVGGSTTGAPSYSFQVGPDGKRYAVGGEVSVDSSPVPGDPQATIAKMKKVHAAALAPENPSAQDRRVAADATQAILQAQSELLALQSEEQTERSNTLKTSSREPLTGGYQGSETDFDTLINQTLEAQESIVPSAGLTVGDGLAETSKQSLEVTQRAQRIESFYQDISQAYEKPANFQFELTA